MSQPEIYATINADEVAFVNEYIHQRTVYAVEYDPELAQKFEYLPAGPAFQLAKQ